MNNFKCNICGNLVGLINDGGGELVCCGEPMEKLVAKSENEGLEKHLPVVSFADKLLTVKVGSVPHPMTELHYINWIVIKYNNITQRKRLEYTDLPEAEFTISENFDSVEVYEYCNIHGLWKTIYKK